MVILDTAGRLHIDEALMTELEAIRDRVRPHETLLVADALTGQDAVNLARTFHERVGLSGIVLTRIDGDGRGGAALSMRAVTGQPIKLVGVGEKIDALEAFHPDRMASRILGMGDVVSLVERVAETVDREEAEQLAAKMQEGQLRPRRSGHPAAADAQDGRHERHSRHAARRRQDQAAAAPRHQIDDRMIARQLAIISSMTPKERRNPQILHASRKRRIAAGSGTAVPEVNKLLKQYQQMQTMMKRVKKMGHKQFLARGLPPGLLQR